MIIPIRDPDRKFFPVRFRFNKISNKYSSFGFFTGKKNRNRKYCNFLTVFFDFIYLLSSIYFLNLLRRERGRRKRGKEKSKCAHTQKSLIVNWSRREASTDHVTPNKNYVNIILSTFLSVFSYNLFYCYNHLLHKVYIYIFEFYDLE